MVLSLQLVGILDLETTQLAFISTTSSSRVRGTSLPPVHSCNMGSASSSQRGKATRSQTVLQESTNANTPKDIPQVFRSHWSCHMHTLNVSQAANIAKDNIISTNIEVLSGMCITMSKSAHGVRRIVLNRISRKMVRRQQRCVLLLRPLCPGLKSRFYRARALLCPPYPRRRMRLQQTSAMRFSCRDRL